MKDCYKTAHRPKALDENIVCGGRWRITMLTDRLCRVEYAEDGAFEDRATQVVWFRDFSKVDYEAERAGDGVRVSTAAMRLEYDGKAPSADGLCVTLADGTAWHYGEDGGNLMGTARTLDNVNGSDVKLEPGIVSRGGVAVLDDSASLTIGEDGWLSERRTGAVDLYIFAYGHDYITAVRDFYRLTGPTPMLPRFALGNWWSRYYPYSEESYLALMDRFAKENIPLTVAVIDMDWHLVAIDPKYGSGWTGFTWNRELFPEPERFLGELHKRGMRATLNLHPADGIRAYEDAYGAIAKRMGVDPASGEAVKFDPANPEFLEAYYEEVLRPMEKQGVDFWWIDWQQGVKTALRGLDPLWVLNHYGFLDSARSGKRPLTFSRYGGPGSHRYPVGFSGDTIVTWESLRFQPYFTAAATNIGYGWWSHDIGGHMLGYKDDELMARWTQFGVFSPIMRLHSTSSEFCGKEPWRYKKETADAMGEALRLRHRMMPYLYTMNRRAHEDDVPLVLPVYYLHAEVEQAYAHPNEYYFGSELLCLPVTTPRIKGLNMAREEIWLPDGLWYDVFERRAYRGGRTMLVYRALEKMPVFAKAGAIVPLTDDMDAAHNPKNMRVMAYLGADGEFTMAEDDGESCDYLDGQGVRTRMKLAGNVLTIGAAEGDAGLIPQKRRWVVEFAGCGGCSVTATAGGEAIDARTDYDAKRRVMTVDLGEIDVSCEIVVTLGEGAFCPGNDAMGEVFDLLNQAEIEFRMKDRIFDVVKREKDTQAALDKLTAMAVDRELLGAIAELLTTY